MNRQKREISLMHTKRTSQGSSVVEQRPEKPCVGSSILPLGTTKMIRMRKEWACSSGGQSAPLIRVRSVVRVHPRPPFFLGNQLRWLERLVWDQEVASSSPAFPRLKKLISYKIKRFSGYIALLDLVKYLEGGFEIGLVACYFLVRSAK